MKRLFAVTLNRGAAYRVGRPLEAQQDWEAHRSFMNALEQEKFVVLGGPLEGTNDVLLIFHASGPDEIRSRLAPDPWHQQGLLRIAQIAAWELRIGSVNSAST
jgi:uncharacterized protein YciI